MKAHTREARQAGRSWVQDHPRLKEIDNQGAMWAVQSGKASGGGKVEVGSDRFG